ncbi:hypothetical protein C8F04DRAFT_1042010 [Mycena alexandri]|uniref:Uncharacterized protein n=1 Tax=Mycena alexandri TaxID=1745969 RepID=A0AAD6SNK6_9AGAR|nr:hypothetical protein C8F04DRAFT_1042010 [Mycena alexandri]
MLDLPAETYIACPAPSQPLHGIESSLKVGTQKVFCDIPESAEKNGQSADSEGIDPSHSGAHRGRHSNRAIQRAHLKRLTDASSNSAAFWKVYRGMADPKPKEPAVLLSDLAACFEKRMNAPDPPSP